ncbi:hypothetical protein EXIGLDRAFT_845874 [Exidia glandulosa HHB12029]|uniref:Cyanovirin-N domain-containing protein n=1 Tax=Exidia glandulosa HHB12029 TaxID=1314781 RepID=A0A165B9C0_EXIGL|nr:hypothetical protein EXIGLDRAFT_845874 [Exidia glandulosa HHB12029]
MMGRSALVLLSAFFTRSVAAAPTDKGFQGFTNTCFNVSHKISDSGHGTNVALSAWCLDRDGLYFRQSSVRLNHCVGNDNGALVCGRRRRNFTSSCANCSFGEDSRLECDCRSNNGTVASASLNLDQ